MCLQELHKTDDPLAFLKSSLEQKSGYTDLLHLQAFFKSYREHNPWESANARTHTLSHTSKQQANRNG
jgi:hypothetical protein